MISSDEAITSAEIAELRSELHRLSIDLQSAPRSERRDLLLAMWELSGRIGHAEGLRQDS